MTSTPTRDYRIRDDGGTFSVWVATNGNAPRKTGKTCRTIKAAKNFISRALGRATGRVNPLNQLGAQRRKKIMARLIEAAENREPMPSNLALAKIVGLDKAASYKSALSKHLGTLERAGLISIHRGPCSDERRVEITATGKRTGWQNQRERKTQNDPTPKGPRLPGAYSLSRAIASGYSNSFLYGALAPHVLACRKAGDIVHRDPIHKTVFMINGKPGDPKARADWHASRRSSPATVIR